MTYEWHVLGLCRQVLDDDDVVDHLREEDGDGEGRLLAALGRQVEAAGRQQRHEEDGQEEVDDVERASALQHECECDIRVGFVAAGVIPLRDVDRHVQQVPLAVADVLRHVTNGRLVRDVDLQQATCVCPCTHPRQH